jgi:hypothetical protein
LEATYTEQKQEPEREAQAVMFSGEGTVDSLLTRLT